MVLKLEKLAQLSQAKKQSPAMVKDRAGSIAPDPASTLAELGGYLQKTRLEQSLSLEEIGGKTLIPLRVLKAIESGDLAQLPEPVYIQAFLKRYADALGIKGEEFASSFPITTTMPSAPNPSIGFSVGGLQPVHLYFFYIGLIILAISGLSAQFKSQPQIIQQLPTQPKSNTLPKKLVPKSAIARASKSTVPAQGVAAKVMLKSESWIQVNADGSSVYEGTLSAGSEKNWQAQQKLEIVAGNAGGVLVAVNGNPPKAIGTDGEVKSATFSASGKKL
jgi:cytoskeletal protein RodZ